MNIKRTETNLLISNHMVLCFCISSIEAWNSSSSISSSRSSSISSSSNSRSNSSSNSKVVAVVLVVVGAVVLVVAVIVVVIVVVIHKMGLYNKFIFSFITFYKHTLHPDPSKASTNVISLKECDAIVEISSDIQDQHLQEYHDTLTVDNKAWFYDL
uniref:Transmembrane protein n=1 Tax=Glossina brevipalpis TaxID=37001 RepID=A0A1A9W5V5_9MUSC